MKKKIYKTILLFLMIHLLIFHVANRRGNSEEPAKKNLVALGFKTLLFVGFS